MPYIHADGRPLEYPINGAGRAGVVTFHNGDLIKIPAIFRKSNPTDDDLRRERLKLEEQMECLDVEKSAYRRLGQHKGIVEIINTSDHAIEMVSIKGGALDLHMLDKEIPSAIVSRWIPDLAKTLEYIHANYIIHGDIAARNVLLDSNRTLVKICDFSDSSVLPLGTDMNHAVDNGVSIHTDIFGFGSLIYEIVTGKRFEYHLFLPEDLNLENGTNTGNSFEAIAIWPRTEALPHTDHLEFGKVIRTCWTKSYTDMAVVCDDIENISSHRSS